MRKLNTSDVFSTMRLVQKAGIKEGIKPYIVMASAGELSIEDIGIEGILGLIEILSESKSERAIYEILAGPFEMTADEVATLELDKLIESLDALAKENNLKVFFKSLSGLIGKN